MSVIHGPILGVKSDGIHLTARDAVVNGRVFF